MWLCPELLWRSANYDIWHLLELEGHLQILVCDFLVSVVPCSNMETTDLTLTL